jgi:hypothetical protein
VADDRSNHWNARLTLANAKMPSAALSCIFLVKISFTITRDMKDELLLVILFFGFLLLPASLGLVCVRREFPSPKAGAEVRFIEARAASLMEVPLPSSLLRPASFE